MFNSPKQETPQLAEQLSYYNINMRREQKYIGLKFRLIKYSFKWHAGEMCYIS